MGVFLVVGDASNVLQTTYSSYEVIPADYEWEKYKTDKPVQGQMAKMAKYASNQLGEFELVQQSKKFVLGL